MLLILNPSRVASELRAGTLAEATKARLVLAGYLIALLFGRGSLPGARTWSDVLLSVAAIGITIGGFWGCFRINQQGDGRAFVERYVCLSVPLTICLYGGYVTAYYFAFWALHNRPGFSAGEFAGTVRPYLLLAWLAMLAIFFLLARHFLRYISHPPAT